jgi:hypothetical protein
MILHSGKEKKNEEKSQTFGGYAANGRAARDAVPGNGIR